MIKMKKLILCFLLSPFISINAFSTGAGRCPAGIAAVSGSHLTRPEIETGTLEFSDIDVEIDSVIVSPSTPFLLTTNTEHTLTVRGDPNFRGFLIRVGGAGTGLLSVENTTTTQISGLCTTENASGITHTNRDLKTSVSTVLNVPVETSLTLDITIVVINAGTDSEYFYTGYSLVVGAPTATPAPVTSAPILPGTPTPAPTMAAPANSMPTIIDIAIANGFNTLVQALAAANLTSTLASSGPFTVFAPTDTAFAMLGQSNLDLILNDIPTLTSILLYHVANGRILSTNLMANTPIQTLQGENITVTVVDGEFELDNDASLEIVNIMASNGVVHVIDDVLIPDIVDLPEPPPFMPIVPAPPVTFAPSLSSTPSMAPTPRSRFFCFSGDTSVETKSGTARMDSLKLGDKIMADTSGKFETVYGFGHFADKIKAEYLQVIMDEAADNHSPSPLELSHNHMVFVEGGHAVPASMLSVGDKLVLASGELSTIKKIKTVMREGAYAPFTYSGTVMVSGVKASSFVALHQSEFYVIGGIETPFTYHWVAHMSEAPHRMACHLGLCQSETYSESGISNWLYGAMKLHEWCTKHHPVFFVLVGIPGSFAFVIWMMEQFPWTMLGLAASIGALLALKPLVRVVKVKKVKKM